MTDPTDEEMERAERIRRLRSGGARSRSHEMREQRRAAADDDPQPTTGEGDAEEGDAEEDDQSGPDGGDDEGTESAGGASDGALSAAGDADVLEMAAALPEDGSLFVVPVREGLRRQFKTVAEQLHLRYGFEYESELDDEQHLRPLALYLGVKTLEDADVAVVKEILESVDDLESPTDE